MAAIFYWHSCPKLILLMRVSGNYIERFFATLFPWVLLAGIICFFSFKNVGVVIISVIVMSMLLFLLDLLPFRKYKLSKVTLLNEKLLINNEPINENEILAIRSNKTTPPHSCLMIEFYFNDGKYFTFLDKPKTFLYKPKNSIDSKSLDIVFKSLPKLKPKIRSQQY